jgi:aspartate aminotransferase
VLCDPGDEVIIISPYWVSYVEMARLAEANPVIIKTTLADGFKIKIDQLQKAITSKSRLLILNSPSNPAGVIYSKEELAKIAQVCVKKDIFILSDEIYAEIIYDNNKHYSIGALGDEVLKRTITVNGVSKTYSMTGWRIGYLGAPKEIAEAIGILQSHSTSNPTSISQKAALAALKGDRSCIKKMLAAFQERRDYITKRLDAIKQVRYFKPQGAFYVFCDISRLKIASPEFSFRLLDEEKVAVVAGDSFGHDDFIRISFATSKENIAKGLDRIEKFIAKL